MSVTMDALIASTEKLSFRLAAWLLLKKKEVSFSDLEALPTVNDEHDVEEIIEFLVSHFNVEKVTQKTASWPILSWETVLRLNNPK
jgi:hypothetical protein